jgi:hypothetical protein
MLMTLESKAEMWTEHAVMDTGTVRSFTDERVLNEFGKAMVAHSYGYYDFTDRMEVLRTEALRRMGDSKSSA